MERPLNQAATLDQVKLLTDGLTYMNENLDALFVDGFVIMPGHVYSCFSTLLCILFWSCGLGVLPTHSKAPTPRPSFPPFLKSLFPLPSEGILDSFPQLSCNPLLP